MRGQYSGQFLKQALGQNLPQGIKPTGRPGEFFIEGVGVRVFSDMRQDCIWDRVGGSIGTSIAAGAEHVFFRDTASKTRYSTSMQQQSRLAEGQEALIYRINAMPDPMEIVEDQRLLIQGGYGEFMLDEDNRVRSGPIWTFSSAYGVYGNMMTTDSTAHEGVVTNGVPSPGANPRMMLPHYLSEGRTFRFNWKYFEAVTITASDAYLWVILDALVTRPVR